MDYIIYIIARAVVGLNSGPVLIHNFQLILSAVCISEFQESRNESNLLDNFLSELLFRSALAEHKLRRSLHRCAKFVFQLLDFCY